MAPSGIFFIPPNPSTAPADVPIIKLTATLKKHYTLEQLSRWGLEARLFRQTGPVGSTTNGDSSKAYIAYMQILNLSQKPGSTRVAITKTYSSAPVGSETSSEPATIIEIPSTSCEDFVQLALTRFGSLWTPRSMMAVTNGQAFGVGDFIIRYGELKQGQGSTQQMRGTLVEIEWTGGDDGDWETSEAVIQGFWKDLEVNGAKSFIRVPGVDMDHANLRQWFDALRLRA